MTMQVRNARGWLAAVLTVSILAACHDGDDPTGPGTTAELTEQSAADITTGIRGSVTGSAHITVFPPPVPPGLGSRNFTLSAQEYSDGVVDGEWQVVAGGSILHGSVDCMTIAPDGASARLSGIVESASFTLFEEGTAFAIEIFDNGDGASGDPDVTTQLRAFRNEPPEVGTAFCVSGEVPAGADLDPRPTEEGNFSIRLDD